MGRKVDSRFNRHDVSSLEWQIDPQKSQSRCLRARPAGQVPAGVADAEADHMSDAVRKKHAEKFPDMVLFPVTALARDWDEVQQKFFAQGAIFDRIYQRKQ